MAAANLQLPVPVLAAASHLEVSLLVLGGLMVAGALWSGHMRNWLLPLPAVLIVILFRDGQ